MSAQVAEAPGPVDLEPAANRWQRAFDAEQHALTAVVGLLPPAELALRRNALGEERHKTSRALVRLARAVGADPPWLVDQPLTPHDLGLPPGIKAGIFDLEGVLTDSGRLHASAWALTFDPLLQETAERAAWQFIPFDRDADYRAFVDGKPRLDGIHAFLASRGIRLPEGSPGDPPGAATIHGLARRKSDLLARELHVHGVTSLDGARRYLEAAGRVGLGRAVVSASTRTQPMLELAELDRLIDERIDSEAIKAEGLRPRPAPDLLLAACARLGVPPCAAVTFTHTAAGVAAGHAAGVSVVGIAQGADAELLAGFGAEHVANCLAVLLERRILAAR